MYLHIYIYIYIYTHTEGASYGLTVQRFAPYYYIYSEKETGSFRAIVFFAFFFLKGRAWIMDAA